MKKVFLILIFISTFFCVQLSAQTSQTDSFDDEELEESDDFLDFDGSENLNGFDESDDFESDDDFASDDDFDSMFNDAGDVDGPVAAEEKQENGVIQIISSAFSDMVRFSGTFKGEVGVGYIKNEMIEDEEKKKSASGYFTINNDLNMTVTPGRNLFVRGGVSTGINNGFNLAVSYLYFDYLLFDRVYVSAGRKGISWGNLRLFNGGYYGCDAEGNPITHSGGLYATGPKHVDIFSEDAASLALDIKVPWTFGTLTFAVTGNQTSNIKWENFNYYGSLEVSLMNTSINLYAKRPQGKDEDKKHNIYGIEVKRTILGFDVYSQGIFRLPHIQNFDNPKKYDYIVITSGIYRLFDAADPNFGFNIEYQHEYQPGAAHEHEDRFAVELGIKRLGKNKNIKIGLTNHHNYTEDYGFFGASFIVSGILPYAEWTNSFATGYGRKYTAPIYMMSTAITLTLDY